jgi:hypothetical protein
MEMFKKIYQMSHLDLLGLLLLHFGLGYLLAMQTGAVAETAFFWIQLEWLIAFYLGLTFLNEYILWLKDKSELCGEKKEQIPPKVVLGLAFLLLLFSLILLYYRLQLSGFSTDYFLQLGLLLAGLLTVLPPIRLLDRKINEVTLGIWLAGLSLPFGYFFSNTEFSLNLFVVSFGLLFQFLAFMLIKDLQNYTEIVRYEQKRLIGILGWQDGMLFYGSFLLLSYFVFGLAIWLNLFAKYYLTLMVGVGFSLIQVWNLRKISNGGVPNWRFTNLLTYLNYFYPMYSLIVLFILD